HSVAYLPDGGVAFGSGGCNRRQSEGAVVDHRAREKVDRLTQSMDHNGILLLCVLASVVLLIFLIAVCKLHAFVALTIASITMGLLSGMKPLEVAKSFQEGVGAVLASIA